MLYGQLLNEPIQDLGLHCGDMVKIAVGPINNQVMAVIVE